MGLRKHFNQFQVFRTVFKRIVEGIVRKVDNLFVLELHVFTKGKLNARRFVVGKDFFVGTNVAVHVHKQACVRFLYVEVYRVFVIACTIDQRICARFVQDNRRFFLFYTARIYQACNGGQFFTVQVHLRRRQGEFCIQCHRLCNVFGKYNTQRACRYGNSKRFRLRPLTRKHRSGVYNLILAFFCEAIGEACGYVVVARYNSAVFIEAYTCIYGSRGQKQGAFYHRSGNIRLRIHTNGSRLCKLSVQIIFAHYCIVGNGIDCVVRGCALSVFVIRIIYVVRAFLRRRKRIAVVYLHAVYIVYVYGNCRSIQCAFDNVYNACRRQYVFVIQYRFGYKLCGKGGCKVCLRRIEVAVAEGINQDIPAGVIGNFIKHNGNGVFAKGRQIVCQLLAVVVGVGEIPYRSFYAVVQTKLHFHQFGVEGNIRRLRGEEGILVCRIVFARQTVHAKGRRLVVMDTCAFPFIGYAYVLLCGFVFDNYGELCPRFNVVEKQGVLLQLYRAFLVCRRRQLRREIPRKRSFEGNACAVVIGVQQQTFARRRICGVALIILIAYYLFRFGIIENLAACNQNVCRSGNDADYAHNDGNNCGYDYCNATFLFKSYHALIPPSVRFPIILLRNIINTIKIGKNTIKPVILFCAQSNATPSPWEFTDHPFKVAYKPMERVGLSKKM